MATKLLTLTMEHTYVERLKKIAREKNVTPSKIVEEILRNLKEQTKSAKKKSKA